MLNYNLLSDGSYAALRYQLLLEEKWGRRKMGTEPDYAVPL
ncbi:MAG: hypothetical protein Q7T96_03630 [Methylobacter sp.]|nr:hypothetical protein [Methylobacter sp.]